MLRSTRWRIVGCALVGAAIGSFAPLALPRSYEGSIAIRTDSATALKMSDDVLSAAIDEVRSRMPEQVEDDLDSQSLRPRVRLEKIPKSDVVRLWVRMPSPELARTTSLAIFDAYNALNMAVCREQALSQVKPLEAKSTQIQTDIAELDRQMRLLQEQFHAPSMDLQVKADMGDIATLRSQLGRANADFESARKTANRYVAMLASLPATVDGAASPAEGATLARLSDSLAVAMTERASLQESGHPNTALMQAADEKVDHIGRELDLASRTRLQSARGVPNPRRELVLVRLAQARSRMAALQTSVGVMRSQIAKTKANILQYPVIQKRLRSLEQRQAALAKTDDAIRDRIRSLQSNSSGRLALAEPPSVRRAPAAANGWMGLALGVLLGLTLGSLWAASANSNPTIRTLGQLGALSLTPVFRHIPELRTPYPIPGRSTHEGFDRLLAGYRSSAKRPYRIGVIGLVRDSGASVTAANVAVAAQRAGHTVSIVEFDDNALRYKGFDETGIRVLRGGEEQESPTELVVYDFRPVEQANDALPVAHVLDEAILLVRANHATSVDFLRLQQSLHVAGCPQLTVVLSRTTQLGMAYEPRSSDLEAGRRTT